MVMAVVNKAARKERNYFEMFRRDFPLPKGKIEYGDRPDVILRGDRTIGIEITNFYLKPGHRRANNGSAGSVTTSCRQRSVSIENSLTRMLDLVSGSTKIVQSIMQRRWRATLRN
jgi:hypothetical protein